MTTKTKPPYGTGRERIMNAVTEVAYARGLQGVTFRSVAEIAQVPNSLIAYHFSTRQRLLEETLEWTTGLAIEVSDLSDYIRQPERFIDSLLDLLTEKLPILVFQYQLILESRRRPEIENSVRNMYEKYVEDLVGAMKSSSPSTLDEETARYVFAAIDGLVLQYVAGVPREVIKLSLQKFWLNLFESENSRSKSQIPA